MFKRILLPLDGSKLAECVLPHLVAIARISEPEVQLLRILEPFGVTARMRMIDPVDWQIRKAEAESYLSVIASPCGILYSPNSDWYSMVLLILLAGKRNTWSGIALSGPIPMTINTGFVLSTLR